MSRRFDNNTGRILIDIDAANRDRERALSARSALAEANRRLQILLNNSQNDFVGRTGDRFRDSLAALIRMNQQEIDNITDIANQISSMVNRYMNADRELAERWRRLWRW